MMPLVFVAGLFKNTSFPSDVFLDQAFLSYQFDVHGALVLRYGLKELLLVCPLMGDVSLNGVNRESKEELAEELSESEPE